MCLASIALLWRGLRLLEARLYRVVVTRPEACQEAVNSRLRKINAFISIAIRRRLGLPPL